MPLIDNQAPGFSTSPIPQAPEPEGPSLGDTFESAFNLENDVVAAVDLMSRPAYKADPLYASKLGSDLRDFDTKNNTSLFDNYRDNFQGVQSREEMLAVANRIQKEQADRDVLSRSGFTGFAAMAAAGILSPTTFIPLVGPATRAKTAWQFAREAALIGAGVGIAQEGVLKTAQEDRGWDEVALGIGAQTMLSGLLGGAVGVMTRGEIRAAEKALNESRLQYGTGGSVGAAEAFAESPGTLAKGAVNLTRVQDSNALTRSPVTYNIVQPKDPHLRSDVARGTMVQLSDGGYRLEGNEKGVPTAPGGTIENRIQTHYNAYPDIVKTLDDNFLDYRFDAQPPKLFPNFRANLADVANATNGKLSRSEFRSEITKALRNDDTHDIPQVAATAKAIRAQLFDPLMREAQAVGILPDTIELKGDSSWILRDYNRVEISRNTVQFVQKLQQHFQRKLEDQFATELSSLKLKRERSAELVEDLSRTPEDAASLRQQFLEKLKSVNESPEALRFESLEDKVSELRGQARALRNDQSVAGRAQRKQLLKDARDMEKAAGDDFAALGKSRGELNRRLRNLNRSEALLTERQSKKLETAERVTELNMKALRRAAKAGQTTLRQLDKISDEALDGEMRKLASKLSVQQNKFTEGEARIEQSLSSIDSATKEKTPVLSGEKAEKFVKRAAGKTQLDDKEFSSRVRNMQNAYAATVQAYRQFSPEDLVAAKVGKKADELEAIRFVEAERKEAVTAGKLFEKLPEQELKQAQRTLEINGLIKQLDEAENIDREGARAIIRHILELNLEDINDANTKRVRRQTRLFEQANALDPAQVTKRVGEIEEKGRGRELDFLDRWRTLGADDVDVDGASADFARFAQETATEAKNRIMGTYVRLPNVDAVRGPRGSEISRTLDIPSTEIEEFLNNDVESLMRQTLKTFPPDIELARRPEFGDINGEQAFVRLNEERDVRLKEVEASEVSDEVKRKRMLEVNQTYDQYQRNMEAVIGRLRHTWGLPQDPEGLGFRLGKTMMNLNVLRLMGGVVISSTPDLARPIMRYGLTRALRDGFIPLITNFKQFKATAAEVKALSGGMSVAMQSRASAMFDLLDDVGRGTKLEQGIEYATKRFGMVALFDYWTQGMKQFSGAVAHAKLMDSIDSVINGTGDVAEGTRFLAENGIDGGMAQRIWGQMVAAEGADKVDGRWWPNTSAWKDPEVLRAYSAAITREVNTSIVTPGVEKPLLADQSMTGRMLYQFKSFALASTGKMLGAGLQQRDAAFLNGVIFSLALGAGSYYLWAMATGGKAKTEMLSAGPGKWADEAIARSGLTGILGEVQRIAERIPATQPYATFSGTRSARRGGDNITEALLGPSFDLLQTSAQVVGGIHDPTTTTVHQLRTLVPGQNISYIRQLFDQIEAVAPVRSPK